MFNILVSCLSQSLKVTSLEPAILDVTSNIKTFKQIYSNRHDINTNVAKLDIAVDIYIYICAQHALS